MTTGMGVELPKMLRVLAHELRGSLGVIQGYVRLLKERRTADETDVRMLNAMLAATARITAIARHASDLAMWQDGRMGEPHDTIKVRDLIDRATSGSGGGTVSMTEDAAGIELETANADALAAAVAAVADAVRRDIAPQPVCLDVVAQQARPGISIRMGSAAAVAAVAGRADDGADLERAPVAFDRGGQGLALVLAASVLDAHDSDVCQHPDAGNGVVITIPKERGSR